MVIDAPSFINPVGERMLSLRSLQLSDITSLSTLNQADIFECIDLTDNDLIIVPKLPKLHRLKTLLLGRNRVRLFDDSFGSELHNLETLSLVNNFIRTAKDLENLASLQQLRDLYLTGNPVTKLKNYRLWCVWRFPNLKVLDFEKVKDTERKKAKELFGSLEKPSELVDEILTGEGEVEHIDEKENISKKDIEIKSNIQRLSKEQKEDLKKELASAEKLVDIERIQGILERGYM
ncbi:DEKNAAC103719 [Brettanomyces naardenensis]|uniref:U2 small nuclear ribonucleoprotein A' n=1 Tax=Brettanomyces naardenensis TaxID=13370 RepID=A0A448YN55_BRENA|nr:DEKNAAC103719 [Brettanomyces naardenensis]